MRLTAGALIGVIALIWISAASGEITKKGYFLAQRGSTEHLLVGVDLGTLKGGAYYLNYATGSFDIIEFTTINANGSFGGSSILTGLNISGTLGEFSATGTYAGWSFTALKAPHNGLTKHLAGVYTGVALGAFDLAWVDVLITADGRILFAGLSGSGFELGIGTIGANGNYEVPTASGNVLTGNWNLQFGTIDGELLSAHDGLLGLYQQRYEESWLLNISTRGLVGTGDDVMISGFIIAGASKDVLVTAQGPSLAAFGVTGSLSDPKVQVFQGPNLIAENDDWQAQDAAKVAAISATGLAPSDSKEAGLLLTLSPGAYTVIVSGVNETSGVAILEVNNLD